MLSEAVKSKLRTYQVPSGEWLSYILNLGRNAVDLSEMGTGKMFIASAVAATLRKPTLVVSPPLICTQWKQTAEYFGEQVSVVGWEALRTGKTPYGTWANMPPSEKAEKQRIKLFCVHCQCCVDLEKPAPCLVHHRGIHCVEAKQKRWDYGRFRFHPAVKFIIFDEIHRACGETTLNSEIVVAAKRAGILTLSLSATAATSPMHFRALGYLLDLHNLSDFRLWARRHGCSSLPNLPGIHFAVGKARQEQIMRSIHAQIIPSRGVRLKSDSIPGFPELDVNVELFDMDTPEIVRAYTSMATALAELRKKTEHDADDNHPLTRLLRARQKIEILKVPLIHDLAQEHLENGQSVAIFLNYSASIAALSDVMKCECVIDGATPKAIRVARIESYQRNKQRAIILNTGCGSESLGLHDLVGGFPRVGLVNPGTSARGFRQLLGRLRRDGAKSIARYRVILAAGTVEERIHAAIKNKLNCLDALNDADLTPV